MIVKMFVLHFIIIIIMTGGLIAQNATWNSCGNNITAETFSNNIVPSLENKYKGEAGKICVIGGSKEYTGAPYFAAISALKAGADLVYVITTESAAPVIKSYSPDLIVYPFLHQKYLLEIKEIVAKMHVIVIGPGLGRNEATMSLIYEIIHVCKDLMKPLVIDADGIYAVSKNISVIQQYPGPGVILTPNHIETDRLMKSVPAGTKPWYYFWGEYVSLLRKGKEDLFYSSIPAFEWSLKDGGSGRRAAGQGDILAGTLGTFYNWAIKNSCSVDNHAQFAHSIAANAAANITRICNFLAYNKQGRSMVASDMLKEIHNAFIIFSRE